MTAAATVKPRREMPTDLIRISTVPGAAIPFEAVLWEPAEQAANIAFLGALGELTGRLERSLNGYQERRPMGAGVSLQGVDVTHIPVTGSP